MNTAEFQARMQRDLRPISGITRSLAELAAAAPTRSLRARTLQCAHELAASCHGLAAATAGGSIEPPTLLQPATVGDLTVDPVTRIARLRGRPVSLFRKEYELLCVLAASPTRVFTKAELLVAVWGFQAPGKTRTLESHATRLRRKLAGEYVVTNRGVGYSLTTDIAPQRRAVAP